jgi:heat shock protein HslJ
MAAVFRGWFMMQGWRTEGRDPKGEEAGENDIIRIQCELNHMKTQASIILFSVVILALLFAGCTTQPQTTPTPSSTTQIPTTIPPIPPITGTWMLISGLAGQGSMTVLPGTTITATFSDGETVSGSAGCNNYVAMYQVEKTNLKVGKPATSKMMCNSPAGIMDQETIYLSNLQGAARYAISGDMLTISDVAGKTLLTYQRAGATGAPMPIANITWNLEMYRSSSGSNIPVIQTTNVTALFGSDRSITGSAGCNSYTGTYTTSGSNGISVGPLATTRMYCGDPGVMDQETAYLALLQTVVSYEVTEDGMLNLMNSTGTPVLVYSS